MLIQTIWCFVTDESGDMDALTVFSLIIGFIAAITMLNGTVVQLLRCHFRHASSSLSAANEKNSNRFSQARASSLVSSLAADLRPGSLS
jgi:hypothetical protein